MWSRAELKAKAKGVLKTTYWKSLLVSIIIAAVGGATGSSPAGIGNMNSHSSPTNGFPNSKEFYTILAIVGVVVLIAIIIAIAFRIFLGYPLEVGGRRFFLQGARDDADLNYICYGFKKGWYSNIVKTMFFRSLYTFLWTILFIIPGIVKSYAYSMVPYILAENPQMDSDQAIKLSMQMTKGEKFKMWVLDLSFILWYLLGIILLFIGTIFIMPYVHATKAQLYLVLRKNAIETGLISAHELSIIKN